MKMANKTPGIQQTRTTQNRDQVYETRRALDCWHVLAAPFCLHLAFRYVC